MEKIIKYKKIIIISFAILFICTILYLFYPKNIEAKKANIELENVETKEVIEKIKVDIKGAVNNPGVYEINKDSRIIDQRTSIMIQRLGTLFVLKHLISTAI